MMKLNIGPINAVTTFARYLRAKLPDREICLRTNGQVSFYRVSSRAQLITLLGAVGLTALFLALVTSTTIANIMITIENDQLVQHARSLREGEQRIDQYRASVAKFAIDLAARQRRLETIVHKHFGRLDEKSKVPTQPTGLNDKLPPEAAALAQIEHDQIVFVRALAHELDELNGSSERALRQVGLRISDGKKRLALGGPFEPVGRPEEEFKQLEKSINRFSSVNQVLIATPSRLPVLPVVYTSAFGLRSDPFARRPAFHPGLDIRGKSGQAIYAAADGRVVRVGQTNGYGNVVVINHGFGLQTLYGHLSSFETTPGAIVKAGQTIARMGSTGRSTGPHLHFEVRINGSPANPLPFLSNARLTETAKSLIADTRI